MIKPCYALNVQDHFMIAHSFHGEAFGPAQRLHGATYVVDLELRRRDIEPLGMVVDIGLASRVLRDVLSDLDYRNLDDEPAFAGRNTTTEFLAKVVFDRVATKVRDGAMGPALRLESMKVTLRESPVAWASYEAPLDPAAS